MIPNEIQTIIDRYLDGLTTIEEQQRLSAYLKAHPDEPELKPLAAMFQWIESGMPAIEQPQAMPASRRRWPRYVAIALATAASLALLFVVHTNETADVAAPSVAMTPPAAPPAVSTIEAVTPEPAAEPAPLKADSKSSRKVRRAPAPADVVAPPTTLASATTPDSLASESPDVASGMAHATHSNVFYNEEPGWADDTLI